jgi:hypothetical protein
MLGVSGAACLRNNGPLNDTALRRPRWTRPASMSSGFDLSAFSFPYFFTPELVGLLPLSSYP